MINKEEEIKQIVEAIKSSMHLEELDELERQYNIMLKEINEKSGSNEKE